MYFTNDEVHNDDSDSEEQAENLVDVVLKCFLTYIKISDAVHEELVLPVARSTRKSKIPRDIFRHLNKTTRKAWIDIVLRSFDSAFAHEVSSLVYSIRELSELDDDNDDETYRKLLKRVRLNGKYFFVTLFSIEHLVRAAKRSKTLYDILRKDEWISSWIELNASKPSNDFEDDEDDEDDEKASRCSCCFKSGLLNVRRRELSNMNSALKVVTVKRRVELLLKSSTTKDFRDSDYDSDDDPESIVGRTIQVKWTKKYYKCKVVRWDSDKRKHFCVYEDGDRRYYKIGHDKCMQWEFVYDDEEDEEEERGSDWCFEYIFR